MLRKITAVAALCALALTACGDDKKEAEQTVREFVTATNSRDTKKFCDELVTQQFLEQSTGAKGDKARDACHSQLKSLKGLKVSLESIKSTKVNDDGDSATVRAVLSTQGQQQDQVLRLKKEDGDWKLAGGSGG